jgi:uncharacterized membrane protein YeaQ/YmgE (transglycosylase-associated protein family)
MIGMNFVSFLVLLVEGAIAAFVLHYLVRYRMLTGLDGYLCKWILGWVGAWLGSPVLGHWFGPVSLAHVYLIPALIGAFAIPFSGVGLCKVLAKINATGHGEIAAAFKSE